MDPARMVAAGLAMASTALVSSVSLAWWISRASRRRRAEQREARILESISDAFVALDRNWRYTYVNARAGDIFGRDPSSLIGAHIWTEFPEGVGQPFQLAYERAVREQTPCRLEAYYPPLERWFENRIYPSPEGLTIYFSDITDRKRSEEGLRQERDFSSAVLDSLPGVFYVYDANLRFRRWNRNFERVTGYSAAEIAAMGPLDFFADAEKPIVAARIGEVFTMGESSVEAQFVAKDGTRTPYFFTGVRTSILGEACLLGVGIDISSRTQAEAAMRASEERLARLVEAIPDGIVIVEASGTIAFANETAERILGLTRTALADRRYNDPAWNIATADGKPIPDEDLPFARAIASRQPVYGAEHAIVHPDGRRIVLAINAVPLRAADGHVTGVVASLADITARRDAEDALRETMTFLADSQRVARIGAWSRDLVTGARRWSEEMYRILDVPATFPVSDRTFVELVHPEDRDRVAEWIRAAVAGEAPGNLEYRVVHQDGRERVLDSRSEIERDERGVPIRLVGTVQDITDRKEDERRIREAGDRLRLALDAARMGMFDWEVPANRITWSRRHEELWGFAPGEFAGTYEAFASRVHPDDLPRINAAVARCMAERTPFFGEFRVMLPDSAVRWVAGRGEFSFGPAGQPLRMRGVVVDVTERRLAEEALRASELRFRTLVDQASDGIVVTDGKGGYDDANPAACAMFGYTREEFLRVRMIDLVVPDQRPLVAPAVEVVESGRPRLSEWTFRRKNGTTFAGEVSASRLPDGRLIGIVRDITERKRTEEQVLAYAAALSALTERVQVIREEEGTRIARALHDELGQSLTGLRIDVSWIDKRLRGLGEAASLVEVRQKTAAMAREIDDTIQTVRRLSSELRPTVLDDLGLPAAIEWQTQEFQKRTGIQCAATLIPDDLVIAPARATALYRILLESLTNVARHARATKVTISLTRAGDHLVLLVVDDGIGLTGTAVGKSLGILGMKERAQALGGSVTVGAAGGRGTMVTVRMPLEDQTSSSVN